MALSPTCTINGGATPADVSATATINGALANTTGVTQFFIAAIDADDQTGAAGLATLQAGLTINTSAKTFQFTSPSQGSAVIFMVTVGNDARSSLGHGIDVNGVEHPEWTTTFKVNVKTSGGYRVGAANERYEQDPFAGWTSIVNGVARALPVSGVTWGSDLTNSTSSNQYVSSLSYSSAAGGGPIAINGTGTSLVWAAGNTGPSMSQAQSTTGAGVVTSLTAQAAKGGTNANGGGFSVNGGAADGSGTGGIGAIFGGASTSGVGGIAAIQGGASTSGAGGAATVTGGAGGSGAGGAVNIATGTGATSGNINLNAQGTTPGAVVFKHSGTEYIRYSGAGTAATITAAAGMTNGFFITQADSTTGAGTELGITAQAAKAGSAAAGGELLLSSGAGDGAGIPGTVLLALGGSTAFGVGSTTNNPTASGFAKFNVPAIQFDSALSNPSISIQSTTGAPTPLTIGGQTATSGNTSGGRLQLEGGFHNGSNVSDGIVYVFTPLTIGELEFTPANGGNTLNNTQSNSNIVNLIAGAVMPFTVTFLRNIAELSMVFVRNNTSQTATIAYLTGGTVTVATNTSALICSNGANLVKIMVGT